MFVLLIANEKLVATSSLPAKFGIKSKRKRNQQVDADGNAPSPGHGWKRCQRVDQCLVLYLGTVAVVAVVAVVVNT